jgi:hypothetical protein
VKKIQLVTDSTDRWKQADFGVLWGGRKGREKLGTVSGFPGDVKVLFDALHVPGPPRSSLLKRSEVLAGNGYRVALGNHFAGELSFRFFPAMRRSSHFFDAKKNSNLILSWARAGYAAIGQNLVLAPMPLDLIQDMTLDAPLMHWAGEHRVPLLIWCGFRFLFRRDAFDGIQRSFRRWPWPKNPYRMPYNEISVMIGRTNAEMWTGAGLEEGIKHKVVDRAAKFGFAGVMTSKKAWMSHRRQLT